MNKRESKIKDFVDTLDETNEMNDKQFVSLSGAGLASFSSDTDKNKHNEECCKSSMQSQSQSQF